MKTPSTTPIPQTDDRTCERCGRSCLKPDELWEELTRRTPWWDKIALTKVRTVRNRYGTWKNIYYPNRAAFTAHSLLGVGDLELILCGDCMKKEKAAQKRLEAIAAQAEQTGRRQLSLFEV